MKKFFLSCLTLISALGVCAQGTYSPTVQAEKLDRGLVAVKTDKGVFLSWRSLVDDPKGLSFDVYRGDTKINDTPISSKTNFTDTEGATGVKYTVKALQDGNVLDSSKAVEAWDTPYMKVHLDRPAGGKSPAGGDKEQRDYTYTPDDVSAADVDGDGEYELVVKWFPTNQADNGDQFRYTGNTILDCYKLDGKKLWRIDLGQNIRSGNHYTQFLVYDFDGDGKAELICKTAPGTIDGQGKAVLMGSDKVTDDYREKSGSLAGVVKSGPEYLTVFSGETGAEINTIAYNPPRTIQAQSKSGWGDGNGNRSERYLACVAYLDGKKASGVFVRGYYTYAYVWAVDFDGSKLTEKWFYSSPKSQQLYGEGTHSITVGDVDADGCDEIIFGAAALDHDGKFMYRTGGGHGDALHLAKMLPEREGLQVMMPHEEKTKPYDISVRDAKTGEILYYEKQTGGDVGRGLAANVSSLYPGYEWWSSTGKVWGGQEILSGAKRPSVNFRVYWDGDLLDELLDGTSVTKPNSDMTSINTIMSFGQYSNAASCNTTKATPNLQADLFGDWREEIILHDGSTESDLLIFTTTIPSDYAVPCLMQDRQYRLAVAWQNCAYNQPPHLSYSPEDYYNTKGYLSVSSGSLNQIIYLGDEIQPIVFTIKNATGIVASEIPEGLELKFDEKTLQGSISGKPTTTGEFTFTLTTTGADDDDNTSVEVNIIVHESASTELMAYFPFDEIAAVGATDDKNKGVGDTTSNTIGDQTASQKKSNGAYAGKYNPAIVGDGKVGNALRLFGSSVFVQEPYEQLDINDNSFSVEFWMNSSSSADAYLLLYGSIQSPTGNWFGVEHKNGDTFRFSIDDDVTKTEVGITDASTRVFDGNWHHIACVRDFDAKTLAFYIDGELVESKSDVATGAIVSPSENLVIGGTDTFNVDNSYDGYIDDLRIYKGAITSSKVKEDYENPSASVNMMLSETNGIYTVVDAMSGIVMGKANSENYLDILENVAPGVYIIVMENGSKVKNFKFIKH